MAIGNITSTNSSQQLMNADTESINALGSVMSSIDGDDVNGDDSKRPNSRNSHQYNGLSSITYSEWFCVGVLCFVNLINYMDRFTIAGVLTDIQDEYKMNDEQSGLLQTTFVLSYMIFAPAFGYLGDRYSRRWNMIAGVALWSATTLIGSYMGSYTTFTIFRALVGIGEASYSTIAPTIISDLFINDIRSKMLALFYFAIPVGSGCGYIIGSKTAALMGSWRWALRVTPILGIIAVVLIYFTKEPERGQHEGSHTGSTSYKEDLKDLSKNRSFMLSTLGFTCVAFVTGALAWWGPNFMLKGLKLQYGNEDMKLDDVSLRFGAITMISGIIGVPLGTYLTQKLKKNSSRNDPIVCACGLFISAPLLAGGMIMITQNEPIAYVLVFIGEIALNLNWAIVADILLYVVLPNRRSTAEAFQILISHAFGDAGSPYLIGVISETLKRALRNGADVSSGLYHQGNLTDAHALAHTAPQPENKDLVEFRSLQYALFVTCFIEILGGVFFLISSMYILGDKKKVEEAISGSQIHEGTSTQPTSHDQPNGECRYNPAIENFSD
ncbi:protein spinster isoform X1 [Sitodiplosis mosellana]|uniref:protein spinster isoform X1 n=1 Tax=Sitodiplosis mosellana TaxID=263140 RepID=UPI002443C5CF|nr:protein spinster isoform X1 [Sitodiplosis mosellana]